MTANFSVTVNDAELRAALNRLIARTNNPAPLMEDIARSLGNITEDAFQGERSPFGTPWQQLSASYVNRPYNQGGRGGNAHPILQRDGLLAGSVTHGSNRSSAWVGASRKDDDGNSIAAIHQFGFRAIPARPFLPVDRVGNLAQVARDEILALVRQYLSQR